MEKNCLVTKYKATVNDNSLLKVGEMFIDIIEQKSPTNQSNRLYLNTGNTSDLVVEVENGEANITLDENMVSGWTNKITLSKSVTAPAPIFVRNGNYRVKVLSKYNLTEVGRWTESIIQKAISVDVKYLKYSPNLVNLLVGLSGDLANISGCTKLNKIFNLKISPNLTGSLSDLAPLTALTILDLTGSSHITGSLSDLSPLTALITLRMSGLPHITGSLSDLSPLTALTTLDLAGSSHITGSLSDLAPLTALTKLALVNAINITGNIKDIRQPVTLLSIYNTGIVGELIEFVKTQRAAGRTTGSCNNGGWWGNNITFNGSNPGGGAQTLSWTENTITNNGVTVNQ